MTDPVAVRVRACACPDTPHPDGDVVYILPTLPLAGGILAEQQMIERFASIPTPANPSDADLERVAAARLRAVVPVWWDTFIRHGAVGWNLVDADGAPVPFDVEAILADYGIARPVADAAAERYQGAVIAPLLAAPSKPSRNGQMGGGTRQRKTQTRKP